MDSPLTGTSSTSVRAQLAERHWFSLKPRQSRLTDASVRWIWEFGRTSTSSRWPARQSLSNSKAQFREFNLLSDLRSLGRFDIVFCRNVLIYFDQPTKARVLEAIAALLPPDGLLYLGGAETVLGITSRLAPLAGARGVYGLASVAAAVG